MKQLLTDLFEGFEKEALDHQKKHDAQRASDIEMHRGVLVDPNTPPEQRIKAADEVAKLRNIKKGDSPYHKLADVLNAVGKHLSSRNSPQQPPTATTGAPQGAPAPQGTQGLPPLQPGSISGGIVGAAGEAAQNATGDPQVDKQNAETAALQEKTQKVSSGILGKIGHGLGVGLHSLEAGLKDVGQQYLKQHPGKVIDTYTDKDGKRHTVFQGPAGIHDEVSSGREPTAAETAYNAEDARNRADYEGKTKYHTNEMKAYRADLKEANPKMTDEELDKAVEQKFGAIPKTGSQSIKGWMTGPDGKTLVPATIVNGELVPLSSVEGYTPVLPSTLPTQRTTDSNYNPDTGETKTSSTSQKVVPVSGKNGKRQLPSLTGGGSSSSRAGGSTPKAGGRVAAMAKDWAENGIQPGQKDRPAVEKYMRDNQMEPGVKATPAEIKLRDDIKKVEPKVGELEKFLEDNKLTDAGQGGMFSPGAWYERSKVAKAWAEYSAGLPPKDKQLGQLIKYAAAIKIMGAAPWMSIGRGKYLYAEIVQHLPEPTDTPAQLYEKIQFYKTILTDAKSSLPPQLQREQGLQSLDPEGDKKADDILRKAGVIK